jgi:hypothetical protein
MIILVDLELQQSIDLFLSRVRCIFKVLTEPGSITLKLIESAYFGSEFTRVKNMACINNKFDLAL